MRAQCDVRSIRVAARADAEDVADLVLMDIGKRQLSKTLRQPFAARRLRPREARRWKSPGAAGPPVGEHGTGTRRTPHGPAATPPDEPPAAGPSAKTEIRSMRRSSPETERTGGSGPMEDGSMVIRRKAELKEWCRPTTPGSTARRRGVAGTPGSRRRSACGRTLWRAGRCGPQPRRWRECRGVPARSARSTCRSWDRSR